MTREYLRQIAEETVLAPEKDGAPMDRAWGIEWGDAALTAAVFAALVKVHNAALRASIGKAEDLILSEEPLTEKQGRDDA